MEGLKVAVSTDVAQVEIDSDNIIVTFASNATVDNIKAAANELVAQLLADGVAGELTIDNNSFNLNDENVASKVAKALLKGKTPEDFLNDGHVQVDYSAVVTVDGVTFNLNGKLTFQTEKAQE